MVNDRFAEFPRESFALWPAEALPEFNRMRRGNISAGRGCIGSVTQHTVIAGLL
jgi:hypothetical protein